MDAIAGVTYVPLVWVIFYRLPKATSAAVLQLLDE
jgi:hypothetical protein